MTYILVLILWGGNSTIAVTTQEFNSLEQCRYVAEVIRNNRYNQVRSAQCFEKGKAK